MRPKPLKRRLFARLGMGLVAGLCLFVPRIAGYAGALLVAIMLGAAATHLMHGEVPQMIGTTVFAALSGIIAWVRLPRRRAQGVLSSAG